MEQLEEYFAIGSQKSAAEQLEDISNRIKLLSSPFHGMMCFPSSTRHLNPDMAQLLFSTASI